MTLHSSVLVSPQLIFRLFICAAFLSAVVAQRIGYEVAPPQRNRRWSRSTEAPLARAVNALAPDAIPHMELLIRHASRVESAVLRALKRDKFTRDEPIQPCNPAIKPAYRNRIPNLFAIKGFPDPGGDCYTDVADVNFDDAPPGYTTEDIFNAAISRGAELNKHANEIAVRLIDNFTRPDFASIFSYSTRSAQCSFSPACMYRVGEFWHIVVKIHSHGVDDYVPDGHRTSILEHVRVVDGKLGDALLMRLPKYDDGSVERVIIDNTTTLIQTWSKGPNPSCFGLIPVEENLAMIRALDDADHFAQQAESALTTSNLAILLLPLALSLVPLSLFTSVNSFVLLVYTLMSDVLTVIPLSIKGVELVIIGSKRFRSVTTRMSSTALGNITKIEAATSEVWCAECRIRDDVLQTGIALIITAVVFLVIGVGTELGAWVYSKKRFRNGKGLHFGSASSDTYISSESEILTSSDIGASEMNKRYSDDYTEGTKKPGFRLPVNR